MATRPASTPATSKSNRRNHPLAEGNSVHRKRLRLRLRLRNLILEYMSLAQLRVTDLEQCKTDRGAKETR